MIVKCRCGERIAVSISTEMIEETGRPKRVGREVCKCGAEIQVLASLYFPTPYMTKEEKPLRKDPYHYKSD